jgi:hypothetical protein
MTAHQTQALAKHSQQVLPVRWLDGKLHMCLSVFPSEKRPSGYVWMVSVAGSGFPGKQKAALLRALNGVGEATTDYLTKNPNGALYLFRDLTTEEVAQISS